jgi:hypothetical protein
MPAANASRPPDIAVPHLAPERAGHPAIVAVVTFLEAIFADLARPVADRNWPSISAAGDTLFDLIRDVSAKRWTPDQLRALVMAWLSVAPAEDLSDIERKARNELESYREFFKLAGSLP